MTNDSDNDQRLKTQNPIEGRKQTTEAISINRKL